MLPVGDQDEVESVPPHPGHQQSSAPEVGRNYRPKHVELMEILYHILDFIMIIDKSLSVYSLVI